MPAFNNDDVLNVPTVPVSSVAIPSPPENSGVTRTGALENAPEKTSNAPRDLTDFGDVSCRLFQNFSG